MAVTASPRIAVVIPCFDDGATLSEAIASAYRQDEPVELVVVDDGSTDPATLEVLGRLESNGVSVVRQANAGPGAARMAGLARTTAPYVLPLDADDVLLPHVLGELAAALDARPRAAAAWGWYERFGDESTLQRTARCLDAWQLTYMNDLPATALLRRDALDRVGGWGASRGYEDWDLWLSLAEDGWEGVGLPRPVYRYRRQGVRVAHEDVARHDEIAERLAARHPRLWAARRRNWRRSCAPLAVRLMLPLLELLPLPAGHRRLLGRAVNELAHGRGIRVLLRRVRDERRRSAL
jgi:glycosyltransferase involved in cell wall biosynthesis